MIPRPALVDGQGGPITGNEGGPMPLAKLPVSWSHVAGKRHDLPHWRLTQRELKPGACGPTGSSGPVTIMLAPATVDQREGKGLGRVASL